MMINDPHGLQRLVRQEQLILDVKDTIRKAMRDKTLSQVAVATRLRWDRQRVLQFRGGNLTLRMMSDVSFALGLWPTLCLEERKATPSG